MQWYKWYFLQVSKYILEDLFLGIFDKILVTLHDESQCHTAWTYSKRLYIQISERISEANKMHYIYKDMLIV